MKDAQSFDDLRWLEAQTGVDLATLKRHYAKATKNHATSQIRRLTDAAAPTVPAQRFRIVR